MKKQKNLYIIGIILIILAVLIYVLTGVNNDSSRDVEETFTVDKQDQISSWNLTNIYRNEPEMETQAREKIEGYETEIEENGEESDYQLYMTIANIYNLLGDGQKEFEYLNKAIGVDPNTGLAWRNMAVLMESVGALNSAKKAYARAYETEPNSFYRSSYLVFLSRYFPEDFHNFEDDLETEENTTGEGVTVQ